MSGITLLTGGTKYSSLLARSFKQNNSTVFLLNEPEAEQPAAGLTKESEEKQDDSETKLAWNKRSPLSARNAVLSVLNKSGGIDSAVLTFEPGGYTRTFHETSSAVYDLQIDRWIKGYGYLLKELIQLFIKQQHGQLSFILDTDGMKVMTPLEGAIFGYFKNLVQSLSGLYRNEAVRIFCFEADTTKRDSFIEFFHKTVSETKYSPGKIHRFGERRSLFDFSRN